ncbi:MAG: Gfo/Idh/MocA family oxidoreductase [Thermoguttaceae bacterium]|jgi:myo-inositol 2-dehydrogenase/D-chiro-inositol 1-dehydrogenase/scyllo-inositol 2-dehydrogenase (NAD+)
MTKVSRLGICVIGTGRAGMIHARNLAFGRVDHAALAAVVDPVEKARQEAARRFDLDRVYSDYREALSDPRIGAVIVATPSEHHCAIVVAAAQAGKHILCEKPMAMNARQCDEMLAAVEKAGVLLQIGFMRRFDAGFVAAKQRIEAGEIGRVVLVKSLTYGPSIPKPWMYDIAQSNGPLSEVNSHDIDTLRWFSGSEFEEVYAIAGNYRSPDARDKYPDFYDNVVLSSRMRNGVQGSICGAQGVQYGYDARCEILGERGLITVGSLASAAVTTHTAAGSTTPVVRSWTDLFLDAYRAEDEDFVRCVREGREPRAGGRDGKAAVTVVNAGNRSIAERRPVKIDAEGAVPP